MMRIIHGVSVLCCIPENWEEGTALSQILLRIKLDT
jgi:hypothetical protein